MDGLCVRSHSAGGKEATVLRLQLPSSEIFQELVVLLHLVS
ncbi:hypothetical protein LEMLEM_LOCUS9196 [Lemmus lemmus]